MGWLCEVLTFNVRFCSPRFLQHKLYDGVHEPVKVLPQALHLVGLPRAQPGLYHRMPAQHGGVEVDDTLCGGNQPETR